MEKEVKTSDTDYINKLINTDNLEEINNIIIDLIRSNKLKIVNINQEIDCISPIDSILNTKDQNKPIAEILESAITIELKYCDRKLIIHKDNME